MSELDVKAVIAAARFFAVVMPKMNVGASALDADALSAWNEAEVAVSQAFRQLPFTEEVVEVDALRRAEQERVLKRRRDSLGTSRGG